MFKTLIVFATVLLSLFLSSCGPVYTIAHDFIPPSSSKGLACVNGCQRQRQQCNLSCNRQYQQCAMRAEQTAKKNLPRLLVSYPQQLEYWLNAREEYRRRLDWHEFQLDMAEARRDRYLDRCYKKNKKRKYACVDNNNDYLSPFHSRPTFSLARPVKPTLASESLKIRKQSCSNNCGCDSSYRTCFSSCGGVVKSKRLCIKNCGN